MTTTPQAALLSDQEIDGITAVQWGPSIGVMVQTYRAYARAIETAVLAKLQATQAEPVQAGELPPLPSDAHWDERIKTLMQQCGFPESRSLYQAFKQLQHEFEREMIAYARAALAARKPLTALTLDHVDELIASKHFDPKYIRKDSDEVVLSWYRLGVSQGVAEFCRINGLEVKP